jgi:hypothetical protein
MTDIHDGDELSISIPEAGGACFVFPPSLGDRAAPACASVSLASLAASAATPAPGRLVAAGAVHLEGVPTAVRFAVRFSPDEAAVEPTAETAREFATREALGRAAFTEGSASPFADGGAPDAAAIDLIAVGTSPAHGAPTGEIVALGGLHAARAAFALDLRESGHDVPVQVVTYGAWAREGLYTLSVEGDAFHAAAIEAFADESARTLWIKDPAAPAPSDAVQIGVKLGQIGLGILVLLAIVMAVLGARTRRIRD